VNQMQVVDKYTTIKPVLRGHSWEKEKVVF